MLAPVLTVKMYTLNTGVNINFEITQALGHQGWDTEITQNI
jgi:hypothetical protein